MANTDGCPQEIRSGDGDLLAQNDGEKGKGKEGEDEVVIQYVVMRRDLIDTWPLGSVVTQGCHASVSAIWLHKDDEHTAKYCAPTNLDSMHKVSPSLFSVVKVARMVFSSFVVDLDIGPLDHGLHFFCLVVSFSQYPYKSL